jgi:hypothetical protein
MVHHKAIRLMVKLPGIVWFNVDIVVLEGLEIIKLISLCNVWIFTQ